MNRAKVGRKVGGQMRSIKMKLKSFAHFWALQIGDERNSRDGVERYKNWDWNSHLALQFVLAAPATVLLFRTSSWFCRMLPAPFPILLQHSHSPAMSINVNKTITVTCSWATGKDNRKGKRGGNVGCERWALGGVRWEWQRDEKDEQPTTLDLVSCSSSCKRESREQRRTMDGGRRTRDVVLSCSCPSWSFQIEAGWPLNKNPPTRRAKCTGRKYRKVSEPKASMSSYCKKAW